MKKNISILTCNILALYLLNFVGIFVISMFFHHTRYDNLSFFGFYPEISYLVNAFILGLINAIAFGEKTVLHKKLMSRLLLIPLLIQSVVAYFDIGSVSVGPQSEFSGLGSFFVLAGSCFFLLLALGFAPFLFRLGVAIGQKWLRIGYIQTHRGKLILLFLFILTILPIQPYWVYVSAELQKTDDRFVNDKNIELRTTIYNFYPMELDTPKLLLKHGYREIEMPYDDSIPPFEKHTVKININYIENPLQVIIGNAYYYKHIAVDLPKELEEQSSH